MKIELVGDGALKSHNATKAWSRFHAYKGNTCNDCGVPVAKYKRYCEACKEERKK